MMPRLSTRLQPLAILLLSALLAFAALWLTACRSSKPDAETHATFSAEKQGTTQEKQGTTQNGKKTEGVKKNEERKADSSTGTGLSSFSDASTGENKESPTTPDRANFPQTNAGQRQYNRALRRYYKAVAGPRKIKVTGNAVATVGDNNETNAATGSRSQNINADSGATVAAIQKAQAPAAVGENATATQVKPSLLAPFGTALGIAAGAVLVVLVVTHFKRNRDA